MEDDMSDAKHWFTAREGSSLAWWYDGVLPMGIIEVNPDHPPIMHWLGGKSEELKVIDGKCIVDVPNPFAPCTVDIGKDVEWSQLDDVENWTTIKGDEKC
jgi:hypothetical protein